MGRFEHSFLIFSNEDYWQKELPKTKTSCTRSWKGFYCSPRRRNQNKAELENIMLLSSCCCGTFITIYRVCFNAGCSKIHKSLTIWSKQLSTLPVFWETCLENKETLFLLNLQCQVVSTYQRQASICLYPKLLQETLTYIQFLSIFYLLKKKETIGIKRR